MSYIAVIEHYHQHRPAIRDLLVDLGAYVFLGARAEATLTAMKNGQNANAVRSG